MVLFSRLCIMKIRGNNSNNVPQAEETGKGVGYWATGLLVMLFLASYCNLQSRDTPELLGY